MVGADLTCLVLVRPPNLITFSVSTSPTFSWWDLMIALTSVMFSSKTSFLPACNKTITFGFNSIYWTCGPYMYNFQPFCLPCRGAIHMRWSITGGVLHELKSKNVQDVRNRSSCVAYWKLDKGHTCLQTWSHEFIVGQGCSNIKSTFFSNSNVRVNWCGDMAGN